MSPEAQTQLARHLLDAFCRADWTTYRTLVTPDVTYEEAGTGRRIQGADAYLELLRGWHLALPDVSVEVITSLADGNQAATRVMWRGTHTGPLQTPDMTLPPTGRAIEVGAVLWHQGKDDRIGSIFHALDVMTMMGQLGLMDREPATA